MVFSGIILCLWLSFHLPKGRLLKPNNIAEKPIASQQSNQISLSSKETERWEEERIGVHVWTVRDLFKGKGKEFSNVMQIINSTSLMPIVHITMLRNLSSLAPYPDNKFLEDVLFNFASARTLKKAYKDLMIGFNSCCRMRNYFSARGHLDIYSISCWPCKMTSLRIRLL